MEIEYKLQLMFPPEKDYIPFMPKVNNKAKGYVKGQIFYKEKTIIFNQSSRQHIADRLIRIHGWKPTIYTDDGSAKLD